MPASKNASSEFAFGVLSAHPGEVLLRTECRYYDLERFGPLARRFKQRRQRIDYRLRPAGAQVGIGFAEIGITS